MKKSLLLLAALCYLLVACNSNSSEKEADHAHDAEGNHLAELEALAYTIYTSKTELFVEFKPLVLGTESRFAAHFTALGDLFKAIGKGTIKLSLVGEGVTQSIIATEPEVPGIFRLRMTPEKAGNYQLVFDIQTPTFTDQITLQNIVVYPDEKTALAQQPAASGPGSDIIYLKEQAWKVEFANAPVEVQPFSEIIRTGGQIMAAPGDEAVVTTQISGIVSFVGKNYVPGSTISLGAPLFTVKNNEVVQSNLGADLKKAEADLATAKKNFERASELIKDKIISEREFLEAQLRYENAQTQLNAVAVSKNFNQNRQRITALMGGFLKNILVENGQFVSAGQPLAIISKNKKLLLRADVSQQYFPKLASISSANFKVVGSEQVFNTRQLNGRVLSFGKTALAQSPFVPLTFEIDNVGNFIPGSVVEVFLQASSQPALVVPVTALLEDQGVFYVYVQTEGESFQKKELKIGASDGLQVQVLSGVREGERVVTKGAYQIKLSTASGTLPAHGHEH